MVNKLYRSARVNAPDDHSGGHSQAISDIPMGINCSLRLISLPTFVAHVCMHFLHVNKYACQIHGKYIIHSHISNGTHFTQNFNTVLWKWLF